MNMNEWYRKLVIEGKHELLNDFMDYYEKEITEARKECNISGSLEQSAARLPGIFEYRYAQLQEVEAILDNFNNELKRSRAKHFRHFTEHYNRELTKAEVEKYVDGESDIEAWTKIIQSVALIRNLYLGVTKALDHKNYMISNVTKLRIAGLENVKV